MYEEALGWDEDPWGASSLAWSLSFDLEKPRRIGPLFRNNPVIGARLTRVDPGGAGAGVTVSDLLFVSGVGSRFIA